MEKLDRCALPIATADKQIGSALFSSARIICRHWCQMPRVCLSLLVLLVTLYVHTLMHKHVCTVLDCRMCLDSDFFDLWRSCGDCNITYSQPECQLSCHYCLAGEGIDTSDHPAPRADQLLAIPAAGCSVDRQSFQLECRPLSQGNCGKTWLADLLPTMLSCNSQLPPTPTFSRPQLLLCSNARSMLLHFCELFNTCCRNIRFSACSVGP